MPGTEDGAALHLRSTLLWAAATGWLGAAGIATAAWLFWVFASVVVQFVTAVVGGHPPSEGFPLLTVAGCGTLTVATSLGAAWLVGRSPGLLSPWLAGVVSGVLGTVVGLLALGSAIG